MRYVVSDTCRILFLIGLFSVTLGVLDPITGLQDDFFAVGLFGIVACIGGWFMSNSEDYPLPLPFWLIGWYKKDWRELSDVELYNYYRWLEFYETRPIKLLSTDEKVSEIRSQCKNELQSRYVI
jgi:hypothetical protein